MRRGAWIVIITGISILLTAVFVFGSSSERSTTGTLPEAPQGVERIEKAHLVTDQLELQQPQPERASLSELDDWVLIEEETRSLSIPPQGWMAIKYDLPARNMSIIRPEDSFTDMTWEAINRCPGWIRNDLIDNMRLFGELTFLPDIWAEAILNCEDPYVDELCYFFAHISSQLYTTGLISWDMDLIMENIEGVYAADSLLDYVTINDYGTSQDEDYYSTVEYRMGTWGDSVTCDTTTIEIDRDIYYMYIVHPRLTDESPKYINPANGNNSVPPDGRFWRDYLLYEPDSGYVSLADQLADCGIMYGNKTNNNTSDNGAIGLITRWIQDIMDFGSGNERPIQPVRIYNLHLGRCGEHQDITAAAARAALIPCLGTTSITEDHVWDEFYDGENWIAWEPVNNYINSPLAYQGWGKQFPALLDWRSDGWVWTVTDRYHSETAWLDVYVEDADGSPMDGARVKIMGEYLYGGFQVGSCAWTNSDGWCGFPVGLEKNIYLSITSEVGSTGNVLALSADDSEAGQTYSYTETFGDVTEGYYPTYVDEPGPGLDMFNLVADIALTDEKAYGQLFTNADFIASVGNDADISHRLETFVCTEESYALFTQGEPFTAYMYPVNDDSGQTANVTMNVPEEQVYYVVIANMNSWRTYQRLDVTAQFYADESVDVADNTTQPEAFVLGDVYPNPFNSCANIRFNLTAPQTVKATVYNVQGRMVEQVNLGSMNTGEHRVALDLAGHGSGTYFVRVQAGKHEAVRRLMLVK